MKISVPSTLVLKIAEYRKLDQQPPSSARDDHSRRAHTVRIKKRLRVATAEIKPVPQPLTMCQSATDMGELMKQMTISKQRYPPLTSMSVREQGSQKLRLRHPLLFGLNAPREFKLRMLAWSQASAFRVPKQKGTGVNYALGRKNWLRDNEFKVRAATIKKVLETRK